MMFNRNTKKAGRLGKGYATHASPVKALKM
jgi:hypothetical protein